MLNLPPCSLSGLKYFCKQILNSCDGFWQSFCLLRLISTLSEKNCQCRPHSMQSELRGIGPPVSVPTPGAFLGLKINIELHADCTSSVDIKRQSASHAYFICFASHLMTPLRCTNCSDRVTLSLHSWYIWLTWSCRNIHLILSFWPCPKDATGCRFLLPWGVLGCIWNQCVSSIHTHSYRFST